MQPGINVGAEGEWSTTPSSAAVFPTTLTLSEEDQDEILRNLRSLGIEVDIFRDPHAVPGVLHHSRDAALVVFAAIKHQAKERGVFVSEKFSYWCARLGLPW